MADHTLANILKVAIVDKELIFILMEANTKANGKKIKDMVKELILGQVVINILASCGTLRWR